MGNAISAGVCNYNGTEIDLVYASSAGVRIYNGTEIDLVYVISLVKPLYWGIVKPRQRAVCVTGRVSVTVKFYPYTGQNDGLPSDIEAVMGVVIPTAATVEALLLTDSPSDGVSTTAGSASITASPLVTAIPAIASASASAASAGAATQRQFVEDTTRALNVTTKYGHYANGDWIHVQGGVRQGQPSSVWQPMYIMHHI